MTSFRRALHPEYFLLTKICTLSLIFHFFTDIGLPARMTSFRRALHPVFLKCPKLNFFTETKTGFHKKSPYLSFFLKMLLILLQNGFSSLGSALASFSRASFSFALSSFDLKRLTILKSLSISIISLYCG